MIPAAACPYGWAAISCDSATSRVVGINLGAWQLPCAQPGCNVLPGLFSVDGLTALRVLNLSRTSFALQLNSLDVSGLSMLQVLDLSKMPNVWGSLPADWPSYMPGLAELRLSGLQTLVSNVYQTCSLSGHQA